MEIQSAAAAEGQAQSTKIALETLRASAVVAEQEHQHEAQELHRQLSQAQATTVRAQGALQAAQACEQAQVNCTPQ